MTFDLSTGKGLAVKSTMLLYWDIHKGTWRSPKGRFMNRMDRVLINYKFSNFIQNIRMARGADCDYGHYLVNVKIKLRRIQLNTIMISPNWETKYLGAVIRHVQLLIW